jgi:hypothetical protein
MQNKGAAGRASASLTLMTGPRRKWGALVISLAEQIAEAQRELALRKKCYPQWVKSGKL